MTMTTIRVEQSLRDRINEFASERGTTAGSVIEALLEEHLERELMAEVKRKMRSMSDSDRAEYTAEVAQWDSLSNDGLEELSGEWAQEWQRVLTKVSTDRKVDTVVAEVSST